MWANREYGLVFFDKRDRVLDVIIPISDGPTASSDKGEPNEAITIAAESADKWESRLIYRPSRHCPLNLEEKPSARFTASIARQWARKQGSTTAISAP